MSKNNKGFTLLEILVVLSIMGIIAAIGAGVLGTVLKGDKKASLVYQIKQNGNYALNVMSRYIRNATAISSPICGSSLSLVQPDNTTVTFSLLATDNTTVNNRLASNSAVLTEGDIKNGVNVTNLNFTCDTTVNPPVVTIDFTLAQPLLSGPAAENQASENFRTSVSLRTY